MLETSRSDRKSSTIRANRLFEFDEINSTVIKALCRNLTGVHASSKRLHGDLFGNVVAALGRA